jgi:hypothetical protein
LSSFAKQKLPVLFDEMTRMCSQDEESKEEPKMATDKSFDLAIRGLVLNQANPVSAISSFL